MVAAALALASAAAEAQHALVMLPLEDPAYVQLEGLVRQGCDVARVSPYRPYLVRDIRRAVARARAAAPCAGALLDAIAARFVEPEGAEADSARDRAVRVGGAVGVRATGLNKGEFRPLWRDIRSTDAGDPEAVGIVRGRLTWIGGKNVVAVTEAYAQTNTRNDPRTRARPFRSTEGVLDFDDAYLNGRVGSLVLSLGRTREAWLGEGEESLVLSAHGPALDRLLATATWGKFEIRALFGSINDVTLTEAAGELPAGSADQRIHRMVAAHAITWRPTPVWELTLGETVLLSRRGGGVDLSFVNPLMPYLVTEHDESRDGDAVGNNIVAFAGARVSAGRAIVTAELAVDDIQIDAADRKNVPDQLAWRFKATHPLPLVIPASVGVEYRRVDSYTYMRRFYSEAYQQYDEPLGTELGPDADLLRGEGEVWGGAHLRLSAGIGRWRHGALRIDMRPGESAVGHAGESYPSVSVLRPAVQRAWLGDVTAEWLDAVVPLSFRAEMARVDDVNNQITTPTTYLRVHFAGSYRFRYP
jgi:hypothetical protein